MADEENRTLVIGAWGGDGGGSWDDGFNTGVKEITIKHGFCIDSVRVFYDDGGFPAILERHGGDGGKDTASATVNMEWEKDQTDEGKEIVVGPWGGNGGTNWDDGCYSGVKEITIMYARCIDSICIVYDKNGKVVSGEKHGGVGGIRTAEIKLQFPEEFLTSVSGHYSPVVHGGNHVIRSLTFKSNRRTFGPFGVEEGTPFSLPMEGGQIVGFKGKSGWFLDAIGFHIAKTKTPKVNKQKVQQSLFRRLTSSVSLAGLRDGDESRARSARFPA